MKKLIVAGVVVFAFALTMNVAFAGRCGGPRQPACPCPDQSNEAEDIYNGVSSNAVSGGNVISGGYVGGGMIFTGASISKAKGINAVNSNVKTGSSFGSSAQKNEAEDIDNEVVSGAGSGQNEISGFVVKGGFIKSGVSVSKAKGINLVNTNVKLGGSWR